MPYANPGALISTDQLAEKLGHASIAILDATYYLPGQPDTGYDKFLESHIPGAAFFDIDRIAVSTDERPHMLPDAAVFADAASALGVSGDQHVIVYDRFGLMSAARAWFMFRYFGHARVSILNGGLRKWKSEDRELEQGAAEPAPGTITATAHPAMVRSAEDVFRNIEAGEEQLIDVRAPGRFQGTEEESWPGRRAGHIPGARNLPYTDFLDPKSRTLVSADAINARLKGAGITDAPVVSSCGSGVTACVLAFAMHLVGRNDVAIYDGSWSEWGLRQDLPVETGAS